MEYNLMIGGIGFHIVSQFAIRVEESFTSFLSPKLPENTVEIEFTRDFQQAPQPVAAMSGKDLFLEYYHQEDSLICVAREGWRGILAVTSCDSACSHLVCYMNAKDFAPQDSLSNLLRMLPMRRILQQQGVLFFHASQIAVGSMGILFSAPSGTGKTTQAKLWRDSRGVSIICNDRTLIRGGRTYGYPVDGSEPVRSGLIHKLGAIVLLQQSPVNSIRRLKPSATLAGLLPQLVIDTWDNDARTLAINQLVELIGHYPVYLLSCTPDTEAVVCLEQRLIADGVIL